MGAVILYKGYKNQWRIESIVYERMPFVWNRLGNGPGGSIIEVARLEGKIFPTMKEAEEHGLELAKKWVDRRRSEVD